MAALLCEIQPGDEVIVPSFTFVSTANAFVLRGAKIVFVDSKENHPNLDENLIEDLITPRTKALVVVHYGGHACEMDTIMQVAARHNLLVIEDAAQAINSFYKGKPLGSIGHLATMSFHETKNIQCGEGGMLIVNDPQFLKRAEVIWEKGTDRVVFHRGEVNKYGWMDLGSSFLPSELNAAYLWAQLENLEKIQKRRTAIWEDYLKAFTGKLSNMNVLDSEYMDTITNPYFQVQFSENGLASVHQRQKLVQNTSFVTLTNFKANCHLFYLVFPSLE